MELYIYKKEIKLTEKKMLTPYIIIIRSSWHFQPVKEEKFALSRRCLK